MAFSVTLHSHTKRARLLFKLLALAAILGGATGYLQRQHSLETNEVTQANEYQYPARDEHLPECQLHGVCSFVQVNARGVHVRQLCRCPSGSVARCPTVWDSMDGHSITQGSDQYKFCERAPEVPTCSPHDISYSSAMAFSKVTGDLLTSTDRVHCRCPENHSFEPAGSTDTDLNERVEVSEYKYACIPLKTCHSTEACKVVTETPENVLVNPKCMCPDQLSCPTNTNHAVESLSMGKGTLHYIRCQNQ